MSGLYDHTGALPADRVRAVAQALAPLALLAELMECEEGKAVVRPEDWGGLGILLRMCAETLDETLEHSE